MEKSKLRSIDIVLIVVCVFMMFFSYLNIRKRKNINEVKNLPFRNVAVENVQNGTYLGDIQTSFLCLKIEVTVKDKKIEAINILEKSGSKKINEELLLQKMIDENKSLVQVEKGEELVSLVYICCVDNALAQGLAE